MEKFAQIISILKIPLRILLPTAFLCSAFLLFANEEITNFLGLTKWVSDFRGYLGIIFVISSILIMEDSSILNLEFLGQVLLPLFFINISILTSSVPS